MSLVSLSARILREVVGAEGFVPWMYLDNKSYVTIGFGYMLPNGPATSALAMFRYGNSTQKVATAEDKRVEWKRVQAISPQGTARNYKSASYQANARLYITNQEALRLFNLKLSGFERDLVRIYPDFNAYPENAQLALIDMIYNLGPLKIEHVFKHFTVFVRKRDWKNAAEHCHRVGIQPDRNLKVKNLFLSVAAGIPTVSNARRGQTPALR